MNSDTLQDHMIFVWGLSRVPTYFGLHKLRPAEAQLSERPSCLDGGHMEEAKVVAWEVSPYSITQTLHVCHICHNIGMVLGVQCGHIWHAACMECLAVSALPLRPGYPLSLPLAARQKPRPFSGSWKGDRCETKTCFPQLQALMSWPMHIM